MNKEDMQYIGKTVITLGILALSWKYPLALFLLLPTWWTTK